MKYYPLIFLLYILAGCNSQTDSKESTKLSNESKILLQNNKLEEAEIAIEKSIQLDPANYAAYNNRAYAKIQKNKPSEDIIADYKKALELKPNYEISLYSLTNYCFEIKDYKNTISNANTYLEYSK